MRDAGDDSTTGGWVGTWGTSGVGTAVETARSSPPVIWSQKQGPSAGVVAW